MTLTKSNINRKENIDQQAAELIEKTRNQSESLKKLMLEIKKKKNSMNTKNKKIMKKTTIILGALFMMLNLSVYSQGVVISDNGGGTADPHAVLDIQSSTRGFLLPRMSSATMLAMPATTPLGMMVIEEGTSTIYLRSSNTGWSPIVDATSFAIGNLSDAQSNNALNSYYIGNNSGGGFSDAVNFTTAVGYYSGRGFGTGDKNTAIGAETGPASGTTNLHHTTTLGYNSKANFSHQVVLGTLLETVIIPNRITIEPQLGPLENNHRGSLYVEDADSNLYYYDGAGWDQINPRKYRVGDLLFGGVIFYVDASGKHGLLTSYTDANTSPWTTENYRTNAVGDGIYAGEMNTVLIIALEAMNLAYLSAAFECSTFRSVISGTGVEYGDWYLPCDDETYLIYENKTVINAAIINIPGQNPIVAQHYWTSNELGNTIEAWYRDMDNGLIVAAPKGNHNSVRPVKRF